MDIRRALVNAGELRYPTVLQLHRFAIAISRVTVNHDGRGSTALDPPGSRVVGPSIVKLTLGSMSTLPPFLVLLVSCVGLGFRLMVVASLGLMLLPGRMVKASCVS